MPKKPESKLRSVQKDGDVLKKKVDKFIKEAQGKLSKFDKGKLNKKDVTNLHSRCLKEEALVVDLLSRAEQLEASDEQEKIEQFDERQQDEMKRLETLKVELQRIAHKLVPPDEGEEAKKEEAEKEMMTKKKQEELDDDEEYETEDDEEETEDEESVEEEKEAVVGKKKKHVERDLSEEEEDMDDSEEEEEEEDESGEEEEETDDSEEDTRTDDNYQVQAVGDFEGEEKGDLRFKRGDILTILSARDDGWLHAMNDQGDRGLVPGTYLREYNDDDEDDDQDDDEDERDAVSTKESRSGKTLWSSVRETVKETSVTDVLQAMGAVPAGFRTSTLAKLQQQEQYSLKCFLKPKLSASHVGYKDLFLNHGTNRVRTIPVSTQRIVTLVNVRQMPLPGTGIDVLSRHVRICLFDGTNILSNVHTIKVASVEKDEKTWNFNTKISDAMKSLEYGECFIRTNASRTNLGILFELCISYVRTTTGQIGEFNCGWLHLPLFDQDPKPVANKTYDMTLNGGTPFERGVLVDPVLGRRNVEPSESSLLKSLMASNKQPHLTVRLAAPTKMQKELLDTAPEILVSSTSYILYISMYREMLTDALLRDRTDLHSAEAIHSPVLAMFPGVAQLPDLMDVLRMGWAETQKVTKRADKKDPEALKELFRRVFMDYVFPLLDCASLPEFDLTQPLILQKRLTEIERLLEINKAGKGPGVSLASANIIHKPFNISELTFNPIGPHCVARVY